VGLAGVLRVCGRVANVRLRQAVRRVWAVLVLAVEGIERRVGARWVVVEQRAADFLLLVLGRAVLRAVSLLSGHRRSQGLLRPCEVPRRAQRAAAGCKPWCAAIHGEHAEWRQEIGW
jgi:hypothetical protein